MSKADYPYPEDEFDALSPDAPTGVHRAPRSAWSRWWPFLVVLVVVPVLAYGAVTYLSGTRDLAGDGQSQGPATGDETPPAEGEGDPADPGTGEGEPAAPDEPTVEAPPPVLTTPVAVLNGARIEGLAGRLAEQLTAAGFTSVTADNAGDELPAQSTVYVASEELRSTGELVATTVGVPTVEVAPDRAGAGVAVVLVTDPTG